MSNTINGKTLEEIFKALKCIVIQFNDSCDELWDDCRSCPHNVDGGRMDLAKCVADAAALIQQQEQQLAEKDARIAELERERDAAVERCVNADDVSAGYYQEIQQLEAAQPKWISVEERLPENKDERCLVFTSDEKESEIAYYCGDGEWASPDYKMLTLVVTHWMPLPSAPKEEA